MRIQKTVVEMIHDTLDFVVNQGDIVVDATAGNGHDTLKLAELVGEDGHVYAFDIQQTALDHTKERLAEADFLQRVTLLHLDHSIMDTVIKEKIAAVVFNLGYLPGGSHQIITEPRKTITALEHSLELLQSGGVILIGVYWGHPGGEIEKNAVEQWLRQLPAADYDIMETSFPNRQKAPIVITLQKKC
ncbi:MAG TPA: methyltransferase domain-containing protein [Firmicutes bacterium]|nr:methyltransferase domain-containing protein [Bacillota bacterium]